MKTPLILLPGLLCDASVWDDQIASLSDIASIQVADLSAASTPGEMVRAALKNAPDHFALAGHSMGGWVALEVMRHSPERVIKLCLANTTAKLDAPEKREARLKMIELAKENKYDQIIDMLLSVFVFDKKYQDSVRKMLIKNQKSFVNQEKAMLERKDGVPVLNDIKCPTVVIHAREDAVFSMEDSQELASGIRGASLKVIEQCGHMSPIEAPASVSTIMKEWLQNI